jgi:hypothetical protein
MERKKASPGEGYLPGGSEAARLYGKVCGVRVVGQGRAMTPHTLQVTAGGKIADVGALQPVVDGGNELGEGESAGQLTLAAVRTGLADVVDQAFIAPARKSGC